MSRKHEKAIVRVSTAIVPEYLHAGLVLVGTGQAAKTFLLSPSSVGWVENKIKEVICSDKNRDIT